jgi:hypothetical protein
VAARCCSGVRPRSVRCAPTRRSAPRRAAPHRRGTRDAACAHACRPLASRALPGPPCSPPRTARGAIGRRVPPQRRRRLVPPRAQPNRCDPRRLGPPVPRAAERLASCGCDWGRGRLRQPVPRPCAGKAAASRRRPARRRPAPRLRELRPHWRKGVAAQAHPPQGRRLRGAAPAAAAAAALMLLCSCSAGCGAPRAATRPTAAAGVAWAGNAALKIVPSGSASRQSRTGDAPSSSQPPAASRRQQQPAAAAGGRQQHSRAAPGPLTPRAAAAARPARALLCRPPQVGRSSPADILLPIPTVSTRHALLRVGERCQGSGGPPRPAQACQGPGSRPCSRPRFGGPGEATGPGPAPGQAGRQRRRAPGARAATTLNPKPRAAAAVRARPRPRPPRPGPQTHRDLTPSTRPHPRARGRRPPARQRTTRCM